MESMEPSRVRKLILLAGAAVAGIFVGRKVLAGRNRRGRRGDGGDLAGVREPRRPKPTTPSDAVAADPREDEMASAASA